MKLKLKLDELVYHDPWQPIENAPVQTMVLVAIASSFDPTQYIRHVGFQDEDGYWYYSGGVFMDKIPRYWTVIPDPPVEEIE